MPLVRKRSSSVRDSFSTPERRVARFRQLLRGLEHAIEHLVEIELREHAPSDLENALCSSIYQDKPSGVP